MDGGYNMPTIVNTQSTYFWVIAAVVALVIILIIYYMLKRPGSPDDAYRLKEELMRKNSELEYYRAVMDRLSMPNSNPQPSEDLHTNIDVSEGKVSNKVSETSTQTNLQLSSSGQGNLKGSGSIEQQTQTD